MRGKQMELHLEPADPGAGRAGSARSTHTPLRYRDKYSPFSIGNRAGSGNGGHRGLLVYGRANIPGPERFGSRWHDPGSGNGVKWGWEG